MSCINNGQLCVVGPSSIINPASLIPPVNSYVLEDGVTVYVAEDGVTPYVPEIPLFVNASSLATATATSITPALPPASSIGTLYLAWAKSYGSAVLTMSIDPASSQWTKLIDINQGTERPMMLAWAWVNAPGISAPKFNFSGLETLQAQVRQYNATFMGEGISPFGATSSATSAGSTTAITCPGITTTADNSLAIWIAVAPSVSVNIGAPSGYTAEDAANLNYCVAHQGFATSGTFTGDTSVSINVANETVFTVEMIS